MTVLIGGDSYRVTNRYTIQQQAGSIAISNIDVEALAGAHVPQSLEDVQILLDDVPFFYGQINSVDTPDFSSGFETRKYRLTVQSAEVIFKNRLVSESLKDVYAHDIIQVMFDNYISQDGITLGDISTTETFYKSYTASYLKLETILKEMMEDAGATCYISPDKKFYFQVQADLEQIPAPSHITKLRKEENANDIRTVQIVLGASEETSAQSAGIIWGNGQVAFTASYQIADVTGMTINGTPVGVGILGLDEADTTKTFLWKYGNQNISVNSNATVKPTTGDLVGVVYNGYYDIIVQNENEQLKEQIAELNGTSGRIESILTDETIDNFTDADNKANKLLEEYSIREENITCVCQSLEDSELYKVWVFNLPEIGIIGNYVLVERTIEDFVDDKYRIRVKLKNKGLFSRYGEVLKKDDKVIRPETLVYKQAYTNDDLMYDEEYTFDTAGVIYYPTVNTYADPLLGVMYPI
jgi:hypothetical protein